MRKYEKYKDSGVEWIGKIPEHWEVKPFKYLVNIIMGQSPSGNNIVTEGKTLFMQGNAEFTDLYPKPSYYCETCNKFSRVGDILMSVRAPVGELNISDRIYGIGRGLCSIKSKKLVQKFLWYFLLKSKLDLGYFSTGSTFDAISIQILKSFTSIVPSLPEQQVIASYLDSKVGEIDNMIEKTEKKIELYEELKKSIITHAVTKGLNPNVKMKDSGVDWIGEIPENWEAMKVAWIYKLIGSGTTPKTDREDYYCENGENWLQTGDLNDGIIINTSKQITKECITELNLKIYPIDSLVIAMYGATIGKIGLLDIETTTNQACCVLAKSKIILPKFSYFVFLAAKQSLILKSSGGGQPNISQDKIRTHYLPIPSIKEQNIIVSYLDSKTNAIDSQISIAHKRIDLLKELKSSLITNVVTGKIKVAPLSDKEYKTQMGD